MAWNSLSEVDNPATAKVVPHVSPDQIPRYAPTCSAHGPEIKLSVGIAPLGGLLKPHHRLCIILLDTPSVEVQQTQAPLSAVIALIGGSAIPTRRFAIILGNAPGLFNAQYMTRMARIALMPPKAMRCRPSETL